MTILTDLNIAKIIASYVNTGDSKCKNTGRFSLTCKFFKEAANDHIFNNEKQYNPAAYLIRVLKNEKRNNYNSQNAIINELITLLNSFSTNETAEDKKYKMSALILHLSFDKPHHILNSESSRLIDEFIEEKSDVAANDIPWIAKFVWNKRKELIGHGDDNQNGLDPWMKIFGKVLMTFLCSDPDPLEENRSGIKY